MSVQRTEILRHPRNTDLCLVYQYNDDGTVIGKVVNSPRSDALDGTPIKDLDPIKGADGKPVSYTAKRKSNVTNYLNRQLKLL